MVASILRGPRARPGHTPRDLRGLPPTAAEREVLLFKALGFTHRAVAARRRTANQTVKNQLHEAYARLGATCAADAVTKLWGCGRLCSRRLPLARAQELLNPASVRPISEHVGERGADPEVPHA